MSSPAEPRLPADGRSPSELTSSSPATPPTSAVCLSRHHSAIGPVRGVVQVPGSKSLTNRALVIAAMAEGESRLRGCLTSEDTAVMIDSLRKIGVEIAQTGSAELVVRPDDRKIRPDEMVEMFIANSGTTVRFLTAMLSAVGGRYRLHGVDRMHARPIGDLIESLRPVVDGKISALSPQNCPPVEMDSRGWNDQPIRVAGGVSSQYLSGLMMAAAAAGSSSPREILIEGDLVSRPYVEMTAAVMRQFGADVVSGDVAYQIGPQRYRGIDYDIEPDASAASYFWATAAITGGSVTVADLSAEALQGDVGVVEVLRQMGCSVDQTAAGITVTGGKLRGVDVDMNAISDTVQTVAPVALFAEGPTRIRGVGHNRFKETDRIGDLAKELRRLGSEVIEHDDGLTIHPIDPSRDDEVVLQTYHDHRMAMGLSLIGLRRPNVWIDNPSCTAKTYPAYFADLQHLVGQPWTWRS